MPKILSIDYGTKNIGLALSDEGQEFAFAYATLKTGNWKRETGNGKLEKVIFDLKNICKIENVERVIVGMPINLSGEKTKMSEQVFEFVKNLQDNLNVPVEVEDERLTTVEASRMENKNTRNIDELSAQILLQACLDKKKMFQT